jgi:co-chaperonin GroES (HSP10)
MDSLIIIPETVEEKPTNFAIVLAAGKLVHSELTPGEMVIVTDYAGAPTEVVMDDGSTVEAHIIVEDDVLGVLSA